MDKTSFKQYIRSVKQMNVFIMNTKYDLNLPNYFNDLYYWEKNHLWNYKPEYYVTSWTALKINLEDTIKILHHFDTFNHSVFYTDISNIIHKLKQKLMYLKEYGKHISVYLKKYLGIETFELSSLEPRFIVYNLVNFYPLNSSKVPSVIHYLKNQIIKMIDTNVLSNNSIIKAKCFIVANAFPNPVSFAKKYHLSVKHVKHLWKHKAQWSTASIKDIKMLNHIYDKIIGNSNFLYR